MAQKEKLAKNETQVKRGSAMTQGVYGPGSAPGDEAGARRGLEGRKGP